MKATLVSAEKVGTGLWILGLGTGTILLVAGGSIRFPAIGLALTAAAFFSRRPDRRRIRSLLTWMTPVLAFLVAYALLLYVTVPTAPASSPSPHPLERMPHLLLRSVGMVFAVFALEEALRPLALRARPGRIKGGRMSLMLGLSYQLIPVFRNSLEGVLLAQRARSNYWWARPSSLMRACSSLLLLSHRLSEELALALSLRLRQHGSSAKSDQEEVQ